MVHYSQLYPDSILNLHKYLTKESRDDDESLQRKPLLKTPPTTTK